MYKVTANKIASFYGTHDELIDALQEMSPMSGRAYIERELIDNLSDDNSFNFSDDLVIERLLLNYKCIEQKNNSYFRIVINNDNENTINVDAAECTESEIRTLLDINSISNIEDILDNDTIENIKILELLDGIYMYSNPEMQIYLINSNGVMFEVTL